MRSFHLLAVAALSMLSNHEVLADEAQKPILSCETESSSVYSILVFSEKVASRQKAFPIGSFICDSYIIERDKIVACSKPVEAGPTVCTYVWENGVVTASAFGEDCSNVDSWVSALQEQNRRLEACSAANRHRLDTNAGLISSRYH